MMLKIPLSSRPHRALLAWALVLDLILAMFILFSPNQGSASGIEGQIVDQDATISAPEEKQRPAMKEYVIIVRYSDNNRVVTRITPDEDGFFRLHVVPGRYQLEVQSVGEGAMLSGSASADVADGQVTNVSIQMHRRMTEQAPPLDETVISIQLESEHFFDVRDLPISESCMNDAPIQLAIHAFTFPAAGV